MDGGFLLLRKEQFRRRYVFDQRFHSAAVCGKVIYGRFDVQLNGRHPVRDLVRK